MAIGCSCSMTQNFSDCKTSLLVPSWAVTKAILSSLEDCMAARFDGKDTLVIDEIPKLGVGPWSTCSDGSLQVVRTRDGYFRSSRTSGGISASVPNPVESSQSKLPANDLARRVSSVANSERLIMTLTRGNGSCSWFWSCSYSCNGMFCATYRPMIEQSRTCTPPFQSKIDKNGPEKVEVEPSLVENRNLTIGAGAERLVTCRLDCDDDSVDEISVSWESRSSTSLGLLHRRMISSVAKTLTLGPESTEITSTNEECSWKPISSCDGSTGSSGKIVLMLQNVKTSAPCPVASFEPPAATKINSPGGASGKAWLFHTVSLLMHVRKASRHCRSSW